MGVASNRLGVRTIEIVGKLDDTELSNAVTFRAQEDLPIPVMDASLDYEVIDQWTNDEEEPVRRVLVAVAYRDLVDDFANAFETSDADIKAALDPTLIEHRDRIFKEHLELPVVL